MNELCNDDDCYRRRSQSLYEYRPRSNTEVTVAILTKLLSSHNSPPPATGNISSIVESNEIIPVDKKRTLFFIWEPIIAGFIIFPLLIIFWQSGWNFMLEWFDTPSGQHKASLPSLYLLSQLIFLIIYINQDRLYDFLVKQEFKYFGTIILQCHSLITALNYIIQWATMWTLWDRYTSDDWLLMLIISIAAIFAMIALAGHPCDLVCAPFVISYDSVEYNVRIGIPFVRAEKMSPCLSYILNYIFYEYIISLLSILAWRGSYALFDVYLYPNNENISAGISLLIGYPVFFILMYTQTWQNKICQLPTFIRLNYPYFIENLRHLGAFFSCVLLWRGYWILFDIHIAAIPYAYESPYVFYVMVMIISFVILSLMKTASSINGSMSHMDDEYNLFPFYSNCFLAEWFKKKKTSDEIPTNESKHTNVESYSITLF